MPNSNQIQLATLLVPVLGLIVVSAVDSVQEDDEPHYRILVAGLGLGSLGPIAIVILRGMISTVSDISTEGILLYGGTSVFMVVLLLIAVILKETYRGMDDPSYTYNNYEIKHVVGLAIVCLWYLILYLFFP